MSTTSKFNKSPPTLVNEESYETWKRDIGIWCELTDLVKEKQALAIHLSLTGRARIASSEIKVEDLKENVLRELLLSASILNEMASCAF